MADLVTHLCTALLPGSVVGGRLVGVVALGTVLPDVCSRVPGLALEQLFRLGVPMPDWVMYPWGIFHMPAGVLAMCMLAPWAFRESDRSRVCTALLLGCTLHLGLDLFQFHHGSGYFMLFPLSGARFELGWISSEATVPWAPWLALATAGAWSLRWWVLRNGPED